MKILTCFTASYGGPDTCSHDDDFQVQLSLRCYDAFVQAKGLECRLESKPAAEKTLYLG